MLQRHGGSVTLSAMGRPLLLTDELSKTVCEYAAEGMPLGRATALVGVNRTTAWRWVREGEAEIDAAGDDGGELGPRGQFALDYGSARAGYLRRLNAQWEAAIKRKDYNTAKAVQVMLASQSPDEFSERRATRSINQTTTLQGEIGVARFATMSDVELTAERERMEARRAAAKAQPDDDWREAMVDRPGPAGGGIDDPAPVPVEKNPISAIADSGSTNRKIRAGAKGVDDYASPQNIFPTRARPSLDAPVEADEAVVVDVKSAPGHTGGGEGSGSPSPSPSPLPASLDPSKFLTGDDDDDDTTL